MTSSDSPLRMLIIGGSGFVSGTLARIAVELGHDVTVMTRGRRPVPHGVKVATANRNNPAEAGLCIAALGTDWDLVVDAIPYTPDDARQDVELFAGRTRRLVFVSTDFVYDPRRRINPQKELVENYLEEGYGGLKRQAELVLEHTDPATLPWTILRPSHIYGPGSFFGCLPMHGRDPHLIEHIRAGRPLRLVEGGRILQHPVFAPDLATTILSTARNPAALGRIFNVAGPEILESRAYYEILGSLLGSEVSIEDVAIVDFLALQPENSPFCCDRVYDFTELKASGLFIPATSLESGLRRQLEISFSTN